MEDLKLGRAWKNRPILHHARPGENREQSRVSMTRGLLQAEAALPASTGFDFAPDPAEHDWTFSIEPVSGYATTV